jgi:GNAT superfamily N-acetyltransferase
VIGWRRAAASLRRTPRLLLLQKVLRQLPFTPLDIGKLCFLRLDRIPEVPAGMLRGAAIVRAATPDDLPALARLQDKAQTFRERFRRGDQCVVAMVGALVIGYEWFAVGDAHLESTWGFLIAIPRDFVYAYDAYIDPAHRNTGVWLRFKAHLSQLMKASGKRGVLTFVDYGNWASLRTHIRFGFQPTETVLAFKVMGLKLFRTVKAIGPAASSMAAYLAVTHHALAMRIAHAATILRVR